VLVGSVIVDLVMYVNRLPDRGSDVIAERSLVAVGGGRNVLVAAVRQGLRAGYAGRHGAGPFGERIRSALTDDGIELLLAANSPGTDPADPALDSGYCLALVEPDGERTFATTIGAEGGITAADLNGIRVTDEDYVYVSGYDLLYPHGPVIADWVAGRMTGTLIVDPSPLADTIDPVLLDKVLDRTTWLSLNEREEELLAGRAERARSVLLRQGPRGCTVRDAGTSRHVPGIAVHAVDSNGAGDAHVGAFVAALARGDDPTDAARWANAAAAISVTREGPATGPTLAETARWVSPPPEPAPLPAP
jgi:sugar/nucleoside kinase (ribokinase family)